LFKKRLIYVHRELIWFQMVPLHPINNKVI
jgi:hypothetical protein